MKSTVIEQIKAFPEVIGVSPYIVINALLQNDIKMKALQMRAITPETETQVTSIETYIKQGGWELLSSAENSSYFR